MYFIQFDDPKNIEGVIYAKDNFWTLGLITTLIEETCVTDLLTYMLP